MSPIFHGRFIKIADGTNKIIGNNEACLTPSSRPFWKYIEDITDGVRTRSQHKRQKLATRHKFETYFHKKNEEDMGESDSEKKTMGKSSRFGSSCFKSIRSFLRYLVRFLIVIFAIVNNGNLLADGRDERRNLQKKYNEL